MFDLQLVERPHNAVDPDRIVTSMRSRQHLYGVSVCLIFLYFLTPTSGAAAVCEPVVARIAAVEGRVEVQRTTDAQWIGAKLNDDLCQGDTVRAGERSRAAIALINQAVLRVDQNSTVRLINIKGKPEERSLLSLLQGAVQSFSRKPREFEVSTPYLNGSIEGTEFVIRVAEDETILTVFEGTVRASNEQGAVVVASGQSVAAKADTLPQTRTIVRPRDAAQWALYYPPVLVLADSDAAPASLRKAQESAAGGDYPAAFAALGDVPEDERDARFHLLRASLLLSVGRVDEARKDIDGALTQDAGSGLGHALSAVIAVVSNDRDRALVEGRKAVELAPDSAAAYIALSYAQQASFDLPAARESLQTAVKRQPKDALAWARLSELHLMFGERSDAIAAAEKSLALTPGLGRAHTALGFAALADFRIAKATESFKKAIAADNADPLPHLGLGLARINRGQLEAGRGEIELAVGLDSNSALLRAYLGKAYFEERRADIDAQQFKIAKELDPNDPTAYLYNGIRLQTENQPVAALKEVNDSIERNNNRAVYRSRLLLDSDKAARNVSSARVYSDLGFQQLALVEGYKSVNTDPSDSSAHRFLADSYSVLPRHEIARVSELLQSQLLDPLNLAPIQPRAAESSLFLISAGGPATASANEFNSLFKRNQTNAVLSGTYGELGTGSGEAVVGGIYNNTSFSLGVSRFQTDGFRVNNDQTDNIGNAFIQTALSPDTSVQFEYRRRETESGDLNLFMDGSFSTALRSNEQSDTYRGGMRHSFAPNSILLASVMYKVDDSTKHDEPAPGFAVDEVRPDNKALGAELQWLYRSANYSITSGAGYFDLDQMVTQTTTTPFPPFTNTTTSDISGKHTNAYVYSNARVVPDVTLTVGASWDLFDTKDAASESRDQINPKLGVTWQARPGTTLRAAGFRALKRSLVTDQTLEPTQVAGFNQFYDDVASSDAWRYGLAVDQKFSQRVFGGVELSRRDLSVPILYTDTSGGVPPFPTTVERADWREDGGRAYLFMTPNDRVALSMEYQYQRLDRPFSPATGVESVSEIKAHKFPLGIRFFTNSGWTYALKGTFVHEDYDSGSTPLPGVTKQSSDFWVVDATASYRLAKRRGFVAFGATNLFNEQFAFEQVDGLNPTMQPSRMIYGRLTLNLP
jgi:Tfp pilus assembly protein PilF